MKKTIPNFLTIIAFFFIFNAQIQAASFDTEPTTPTEEQPEDINAKKERLERRGELLLTSIDDVKKVAGKIIQIHDKTLSEKYDATKSYTFYIADRYGYISKKPFKSKDGQESFQLRMLLKQGERGGIEILSNKSLAISPLQGEIEVSRLPEIYNAIQKKKAFFPGIDKDEEKEVMAMLMEAKESRQWKEDSK